MPHSLAAVVRDDYSAPFFDAAAGGRLLLRYSPSSGEWSEPTARVCSSTQAQDLEWREAAGTGHLVSWTVKPGRATETTPAVPVVIGLVELDEGPWLNLQLPDVNMADLRVGVPLRVEWAQPEGSEYLPVAGLA